MDFGNFSNIYDVILNGFHDKRGKFKTSEIHVILLKQHEYFLFHSKYRKFTRVACNASVKSAANLSCSVRLISRTVSTLNFRCDLKRTLNKFFVSYQSNFNHSKIFKIFHASTNALSLTRPISSFLRNFRWFLIFFSGAKSARTQAILGPKLSRNLSNPKDWNLWFTEKSWKISSLEWNGAIFQCNLSRAGSQMSLQGE